MMRQGLAKLTATYLISSTLCLNESRACGCERDCKKAQIVSTAFRLERRFEAERNAMDTQRIPLAEEKVDIDVEQS
jgi:hypothetical protein